MSELTEVRFWAQVIGDAKRTIVCNPDLESRIKTWIDVRSMSGILKVEPNPYCPMDRVFVIDEQAINATLDRPLRLRAL